MSGKAPAVDGAGRNKVAERLHASAKYQNIHVDTIADIVNQEAVFAVSEAELERRARLKLHATLADYLLSARPSRVLRRLNEVVADDPEAVRSWSVATLSHHASTAERVPDLDRLYPAMLDLTGPARSIADLACAFNPLTVPWLRAVSSARYTGYDLNRAYVEVGNMFLGLADPSSTVRHCDVLVKPEEIHADVALLLKTYHCMENRRPGAALRLVENLATPMVVVSFPLRTLSGRAASFTRPYIEQLTDSAAAHGWELRRASLSTEELVVIAKAGVGAGAS